MIDKITVKFIDKESSKDTIISVAPNQKIIDTLRRLRENDFISAAPSDSVYALFKQAQPITINANQSFQEANISDNDEITIAVVITDIPRWFRDEAGIKLKELIEYDEMIPVGKIQVTFSDITGSRHAEVTMKSSLTAEAAIQKLLSNNFLSQPEPGQVYTIINSFNQKEIQPNQTFFEAGVQNGDTLIVGILTRGGGGIPIRSFRDVQLLEGVINNNKILRDLNGWVFFALILYTEEDKVLSTYIREHILDIHEMSGSCIFFVIEEPSTEWLTEAKRYLGTLTEIYFDTIWKRLGVDSYKPFDKSKAYEIARHFGIQPKQLPCIIFFTELSSQEIVIIQQYLRQLDSRNWFKNGVNHAQAGNLFKDLG